VLYRIFCSWLKPNVTEINECCVDAPAPLISGEWLQNFDQSNERFAVGHWALHLAKGQMPISKGPSAFRANLGNRLSCSLKAGRRHDPTLIARPCQLVAAFKKLCVVRRIIKARGLTKLAPRPVIKSCLSGQQQLSHSSE